MKHRINQLLLLCVLALGGCGDPASQPITLYRDYVGPGNGMVHLVSWNDPDGDLSLRWCEDLRKLYERTNKRPYVCARVIYEEFRPQAKWRLAD